MSMTEFAPVLAATQEDPQQEKKISREPQARLLRSVVRRPFILVLLLVAISLGMVRIACWRIPAISNMDEFSLLLQADTFRHLRLTNPTHPLWQSFETLHVIQVPSYASKFPPAPAVMLALGITIFGNPIWGSWLATVAAVLAVFWMFAGWLPRRWAFIGAVLALMTPVALSWEHTYMACGIGLTGAAVAIGAARRILRRGGWFNGAFLAFGCGIMANTRPFEGFVPVRRPTAPSKSRS